MRSARISSVAIAALCALVVSWLSSTAGTAAQGPDQSTTAKKVPVDIKVKCPKDADKKFKIEVTPMVADVWAADEDTIEWKLDKELAGDTDKNLGVEAIDHAKWPFTKKSDFSTTGTIEMTEWSNPAPGEHKYRITVWCPGYDGPIVLDPRIKVH